MSSLAFLGNATSYLRIPNTNELNFGTGDFTIEWYQYQTDTNAYPRIFQMGNADPLNVSIGVSIEGGSFYYWKNNTHNTGINISDYENKWVHFAISRASGVTKIFMNGISISSFADTTNFNDNVNDLYIANESTPKNISSFGGYITYFTWVKGVALYTTNFTVSNTYPSLTSDYVLLITASSSTGTLGNTVVTSNVSTVQNVPPNFSSTNNNQPSRSFFQPLFTNNAMVFYKPNSLASCGVGTVRNSSTKARRV
jgi:hypothetical protein